MIAALRHWKNAQNVRMTPEWDIATDSGTIIELDNDEIENLIQEIELHWLLKEKE